MSRLLLLNKPYGVLTQFTDGGNRPTLAEFIPVKGVYPAGRLDRDSEGLVLLTDDGLLQHRIAEPKRKLPKTYWVQVEGAPGESDLEPLRQGVMLKDGPARPAKARIISAPDVWDRTPPIRYRATIPTTWLEIVITEGRNRQVRRMTAALGFPTLRLIRYAVGSLTVDSLLPGQWRDATAAEIDRLRPPGGGTAQRNRSTNERKRSVEAPRNGRRHHRGKRPFSGR
jgi:23S rRNA pseudouridine2457 synthase